MESRLQGPGGTPQEGATLRIQTVITLLYFKGRKPHCGAGMHSHFVFDLFGNGGRPYDCCSLVTGAGAIWRLAGAEKSDGQQMAGDGEKR